MLKIFHRFSFRTLSAKHLATDLFLMTISLYVSLFLRTGSATIDQHLQALEYWTPIFLAIRLLCYIGFGVYQCMWRYVSTPDAIRLSEATGFSVLCMISATYIYRDFGTLPRSFFFIDAVVCLALLTGARLFRRMLYERQDRRPKTSALSTVLIYGAGSTGRMFVQRIAGDRGIRVLGFLDDDPKKQNKVIQGLSVLGSGHDLENLLRVTMPSDLVVA